MSDPVEIKEFFPVVQTIVDWLKSFPDQDVSTFEKAYHITSLIANQGMDVCLKDRISATFQARMKAFYDAYNSAPVQWMNGAQMYGKKLPNGKWKKSYEGFTQEDKDALFEWWLSFDIDHCFALKHAMDVDPLDNFFEEEMTSTGQEQELTKLRAVRDAAKELHSANEMADQGYFFASLEKLEKALDSLEETQ